MRRIVFGLMILLAILTVAADTGYPDDVKKEIQEKYGIDVDQAYEEELKNLGEVPIEFGFNARSSGRLTIIGGTVYDTVTQDPIAEVPVTVYCEHNGNVHTLGDKDTNNQGFYSVWTFNFLPGSRCIAGDEAWIDVEYQGQTWTSDRVTVDSEIFYDHATVNAFIGVPEFSTATLGLAVVFGCLGLVLLRKR